MAVFAVWTAKMCIRDRFYGSTILPFVDHFPKNTELYRIMTTKPQELKKEMCIRDS